MPLIPAHERQKQVNLHDFKVFLVYIGSSKPVRDTQSENTELLGSTWQTQGCGDAMEVHVTS